MESFLAAANSGVGLVLTLGGAIVVVGGWVFKQASRIETLEKGLATVTNDVKHNKNVQTQEFETWERRQKKFEAEVRAELRDLSQGMVRLTGDFKSEQEKRKLEHDMKMMMLNDIKDDIKVGLKEVRGENQQLFEQVAESVREIRTVDRK